MFKRRSDLSKLLNVRFDAFGYHKRDELIGHLLKYFLGKFLRPLLDIFLELHELDNVSDSCLPTRVS